MKNLRKIPPLIFVICYLMAIVPAKAQEHNRITKKNISFIDYPGFPQQHSTWFDIGYNKTYQKVYVGVTNHHNAQAIYAYDTKSNDMELKDMVDRGTHLRSFQWQGKIHSKFIEGPDGDMYFATDGGESREEYLMNHPQGYGGGFFMKWDPRQQKLENLGMGMEYESIKDVDIDPETGNLYGISYPQVHFLVYDVKSNKMQDLGRLGSSHVPRVLFTDTWGNCYYVDWRQRLVKYEKSKKELVFAKNSLPAFDDTPGTAIITGLTAYAKDQRNNIIYLTTYGGKLLAFHPQKKGIGQIEDLGGVIEKKDLGAGIKIWRAMTPDLALADNGRLYYFVGGEGRYPQKDTVLFMEYDPKTEKKRLLFKYSTDQINFVSGSNTTDKNGNLYFGAMKRVKIGERNKTVPFMIKFNPSKEVEY